MEKWKKDRPSSTFDPRRRCTGYQMVWAVARHNQELLEKMERERGHLTLPLTRSTSMLSLSPKRWRKGGKINEGEREGGARVVRHLSMGAKDQRWTGINFKHSQTVQEDEDADSNELIDQRQTEKLNLPNMAVKASQDSSKDQIEQEKPISTGKHESLISETAENKKQTEGATLVDPTANQLQLAEPQSDSQSHFLEQNSKINDQDGTQKHLEGNTEPEIEENVQHSQWDTEELAAAVEKRAQSDTVSKGENSSHGDADKEEHHSSEPITLSQTQPAAEIDGLDQTQEQEEENTKAQEDLEHSEHLHSKTEVEEILVSSITLTGSSEGLVPCLKAAEATKGNDESSLTANSGGENSDTPTQNQITERPSDITASTQDPDGKNSLTQISPPEVPAPEKVLGTAGEDKNTESLPETTVENDVFDPIKLTDSNIDLQGGELRNSCLAQASSRCNSRSSGDFCIRKSSSSRLGRRLSEDLFTVPQKPSQQEPTESNPGDKHAKPLSNLGGVNSAQDSPDAFSVKSSETNLTDQQQGTPNPHKGFSFFRKLRGQTPKNQKGTPKIQVPKIFIQDFSDGTGTEKPMREYREEKLNSRERRRRQREQDRWTKEEKVRKKREKEQEKVTERGKRNAQTGQDVHVQGDRETCEGLHPGKHRSHRQRNSTSYAESYF